jgi:hypothetical protein
MLAFGLLFLSVACTTQPLIEDAKLNLAKQNYNQALKQIQKALEEQPKNADAYYYRGYIHWKIAQGKKKPAARSQNYTVMHNALTKAKTLYEEQNRAPKEYRDIDPLLQSEWSSEHNSGVQILEKQSESGSTNAGQLDLAIAHLTNATTLIPDSLVSYRMLALAYEQKGATAKLLSTLDHLQEQSDTDLSDQYHNRIAQALLKEGLTDSAYSYYQQHQSLFESDSPVPVSLAQRYIQQQDHERSVELLTPLQEQHPDSLTYLMNLGAEQYLWAKEQTQQLRHRLDLRFDRMLEQDSTIKVDTVAQLADSQRVQLWSDSLHATYDHIQLLLAGSEAHYLRAGTLNPDNLDVLTAVGTYFHNASRVYQKLLPYVHQQERAEISQTIDDYLTTALPYMERVAEENPKNIKIWEALYHAYTYMNMTEKANEAFQKAEL